MDWIKSIWSKIADCTKNCCGKTVSFARNINWKKIFNKQNGYVSLIIISLIPLGYTGYFLVKKIIAECHFVFMSDVPLFMIPANTILNGGLPYVDAWETKPPGLFYLYALVKWLTGDFRPINFISAFMLAVIPLVMIWVVWKRKKDDYILERVLGAILAFCFGSILCLFSWRYAGFGLSESFGLFFSVCYLAVIATGDNFSFKSWRLYLSAFFISGAVMMKDPFAFTIIGVGFVFCEDWKNVWEKLVLPSMIGAVIAIAFMASVGVLKVFFTIYLKMMIPAKTGNPIPFYRIHERFYHFYKMAENLYKFFDGYIVGFGALLFGLLGLWAILRLLKSENKRSFFFNVFAVIIAIFFGLYSVICSVHLFDHQHVAVIAVVLGAIIVILEEKKFLPLMLIFAILFGVNLPRNVEYWNGSHPHMDVMKARAELVDEFLDSIGEDNYTYLGWIWKDNGFQMYTKAKLVGPYICPMWDLMGYLDQNIITRQFPTQLASTNVIFVMEEEFDHISMGPEPKQYMIDYLAENFVEKTEMLPKSDLFSKAHLYLRKSIVK